jgi:hydrogenase maturation protease
VPGRGGQQVRAHHPILIAGVGNIFLGDDAFGVEVAQRLLRRPWPDGVRVVDFGIRGFDLAYALMADDLAAGGTAILIDALPCGEAPGTLSIVEADLDALGEFDTPKAVVDTHGMHPVRVLRLVQTLGGTPPRVLVLGCEPSNLDPDMEGGQIGLSPPVGAAVDTAIEMLEALVGKLRAETGTNVPA